MPTHEYRCPECRRAVTTFVPIADTPPRTLLVDCPGCRHMVRYTKNFSFSFQPPMAEHFNRAVNKPIHSMRQFREELKRKSEEATLTTGIEHNYVPVDLSDHEAIGVSNEGIDESNIQRERMGAPLLPEIR